MNNNNNEKEKRFFKELKQKMEEIEPPETDSPVKNQLPPYAYKNIQTIFQGINDALLWISSTGVIIFASPMVKSVYGYHPDGLIGKHIQEITPPDDLQKILDAVNDVFKGMENQRFKIWQKDITGCIFFAEASVSIVEKDTARIAQIAVRDITSWKETQEKLENTNRFLNHILESSSYISIIATYRDRTIEYWNSGAENMFGYSSSEVLGHHKIDILYPQDIEETREIIEEARANALNNKKGITCEVIERRKDGKNIWVRLTITPRCDDDGNVNGILGIGQDITEQKKAELERKQSMDKLRKAIGGIVTAMSRAVETRDPYTAGHQRRTTDLARAIAKEMNLEKDRIEAIRLAGSIHDLGKLYVPAEILNKPGALDEHEIGLIQKHVEAGYEIVKHIDFPWPIADIIHQHHEKMDGSGYPKGLAGKDILLEARILAVADIVESMSSHRPYRPALGLEKALEEITKNRDTFYDGEAVNCCLRLFKEKRFQLMS